MKIFELIPEFVDNIPEQLIEGVIYITEKHQTSIHLCACGCKKETVCPLNKDGWVLTKNNNTITLRPSIGNFKDEHPYHAHYFITNNKIQWC